LSAADGDPAAPVAPATPAFRRRVRLRGLPRRAATIAVDYVAAAAGLHRAAGWRVARHCPWRAGLLGLAYGTAWLGAGTWWLFVSLHDYGGLPAWLAALSVALLSASLSLYLALAMAAFVRARSGHQAFDALLFGALWLLVELARASSSPDFRGSRAAMRVDSPPPASRRAGTTASAGDSGTRRLGSVQDLRRPAGCARRRRSGRGARRRAAAAHERVHRAERRLNVTLLQGNVPQDEKFTIKRLPATLGWTRGTCWPRAATSSSRRRR
jgi:apolipoprotein N-acyltransferase